MRIRTVPSSSCCNIFEHLNDLRMTSPWLVCTILGSLIVKSSVVGFTSTWTLSRSLRPPLPIASPSSGRVAWSTRSGPKRVLKGEKEEEGDFQGRALVPRRVVILPDHRADCSSPALWHHHLKHRLLESAPPENSGAQMLVTIEEMPDPYSFNNKRYESFWLHYMSKDLKLDPETLVVAHGTSADAVLRYLERHKVWGALLVCPGGELYHAGERHGRAYVWTLIRKACPWLGIVHGRDDPFTDEDETWRVKAALGIPDELFRIAEDGDRRFRDHTGSLKEVEDLATLPWTHNPY
ncbi:unnamed protein product [Choristocarpus tenellus]